MEKDQRNQHISDSDLPPQNVAIPDSSLPQFSEKSGDLISLLSPVGSPENSPPRSSLGSDHITINPGYMSPKEHEKLSSPERVLPLVVVNDDEFVEPTENRAVLEESTDIEKWAIMEEPKALVTKTDAGGGEAEDGGDEGGQRRVVSPVSKLQRIERENMVKKAALVFRVFGFSFCLVSLAVMAANINQGWALDSFYNYREFRYCMSVNGIGFLYSGAQAVDLSYNLATGKYIMHRQQQLRYYSDFAVDQMIAYLLISASSSAAVRVDDWQSNWGRDKFTTMATASISVSFVGFLALAFSSLISGYLLCTSKSPSPLELPSEL